MPRGQVAAALLALLLGGAAPEPDHATARAAMDRVGESYYRPERLAPGWARAPADELVPLAARLRQIDGRIRLEPPADPVAEARLRSVQRNAGLEIAANLEATVSLVGLPGTLADHDGLGEGVVLRAINGRRIRHLDDARLALASQPPHEPLRLDVIDADADTDRNVLIPPPTGGWLVAPPPELPIVRVVARRGVIDARIVRFEGGRIRSALDAALHAERADGRPLVIDLRHNGGGSLIESLLTAALLLPPGTPMGGLQPPVQNLGHVIAHAADPWLDRRVFVIIDRYTASAAEVFAAILQTAGRAVLVGETSSGKCVVEQQFELPAGWRLTLPVAEFRPAGRPTCHLVGVEPELRLSAATLGRFDAVVAALYAVPAPVPRISPACPPSGGSCAAGSP